MALSLHRYTSYSDGDYLYGILIERNRKEREKSMLIAMKDADILPEVLLLEILSWLPVKALLQFKTVSKSWYAIITSPGFISKHLKNYYDTSDSDCLLAQYCFSHAELQVYELLVDETPNVIADVILYDIPMYASDIYGPCDGIYFFSRSFCDNERALWNPAINELKVLPPLIRKCDFPSGFYYASHEVYGFGYDESTQDYKVVIIKGYWSTKDDTSDVSYPPLSIFVYSLKADSWRYCGDLAEDYELKMNMCYIFVNGCFYWLGTRRRYENSDVIICFDIIAGAFQELHVPNYERPACNSLGVYQDCVAFLTVHETGKRFEIWTLNEEGLWTKKFTINPLSVVLRNPVGHWKNNKFILECQNTSELVLCDPNTQELSPLGFQMGGRYCQGVYVYKESLVSIKDKIE